MSSSFGRITKSSRLGWFTSSPFGLYFIHPIFGWFELSLFGLYIIASMYGWFRRSPLECTFQPINFKQIAQYLKSSTTTSQSPILFMASRMIIKNTSRDVIRKLDQAMKKCSELKKLSVPTALIYSMSKTNGLYIVGDPKSSKIIRMKFCWIQNGLMKTVPFHIYTVTAMLPPLPDTLSCLNGITMKYLIWGILKDLNLSWMSEKPVWWPADIPY